MSQSLPYLIALGVLWVVAPAVGAEEAKPGDVVKMLNGAKLTLEQGLTASESQGKPISGKFEIDEGRFQLSIYAVKDGKFYEVIVDHNTGAVAGTEAMHEAADLAEAKAQNAAMSKAAKTLKSAVHQAEQANPGSRAMSVTPKLEKGHAVAVVTLVKGTARKTVMESLE
jgi:uncharacterized membrane protein YkoI